MILFRLDKQNKSAVEAAWEVEPTVQISGFAQVYTLYTFMSELKSVQSTTAKNVKLCSISNCITYHNRNLVSPPLDVFNYPRRAEAKCTFTASLIWEEKVQIVIIYGEITANSSHFEFRIIFQNL